MNSIKHFLIIPAILLCLSSTIAQQTVSSSPSQKPGATNPPTTTRNAATERGQAISGRVLDDAGKPVGEASVMAVRAGVFSQALNQSPKVQMSKLQRNTVTDNDGKFKLDELAAGAYLLNATAPGYVLANEFRMRSEERRVGKECSSRW